MTETEIRQSLVDGLAYSNIFRFREAGIADAFVAGEADMPIAELDLDSLSSMELCIAIEANTGVSVLPADLPEIGTLDNLVKVIKRDAA